MNSRQRLLWRAAQAIAEVYACRLKMTKRPMYGRAGVDLLRIRFLNAA